MLLGQDFTEHVAVLVGIKEIRDWFFGGIRII